VVSEKEKEYWVREVFMVRKSKLKCEDHSFVKNHVNINYCTICMWTSVFRKHEVTNLKWTREASRFPIYAQSRPQTNITLTQHPTHITIHRHQ
jgi:hypothetical protein